MLSEEILDRFRLTHGQDIDLTIRKAYTDILASLGNPQDKLPPTIVVAGTNGKGSTCAFMRSILEAAGLRVHVFTSPHLVSVHERIRIAGELITEEELCSILKEIEGTAPEGSISIFEANTIAAFLAFARHEADVCLLEVGLGGRLDATNVLDKPAATLITRLSFDHRDFLGETMEEIAREKAGIFRLRVPCFTAPQPSTEAMQTLRDEASRMDVPLFVGGEDWRIEAVSRETFRFLGPARKVEDMPRPALVGTHQMWNAGLAIAALEALPFDISDEAICAGMKNVSWPGRLQKLDNHPFLKEVPDGWEIWLDGGHNDSAAEVLAAQMRRWKNEDDRPIDLIYAMLSSKNPEEFLEPILPFVRQIITVRKDGEVPGILAEELAQTVKKCGFNAVEAASTPQEALKKITASALGTEKPGRLLFCGSLYLAGDVLAHAGLKN